MSKPKLKSQLGYTLLEILVVLVIISIAASMAILTIGHNQNKQLESFTNELIQTLTLAQEQALLQPATLGLVFTANTYGFYKQRQLKTEQRWEALSDPELGQRPIPADLELTLEIANKQVPLSLETSKILPALLISTNGDLTPFTLLIGYKEQTPRYKIIGEKDGTLSSELYTDHA